MSTDSMRNDEVQYYASPILVKNQKYFATLTSTRLIIEGAVSREFKTTSLLAAYPEPLDNHEPGMKLVIATKSGQKEMIWSFPVNPAFREGERDAWISNITEIIGENPLAVPEKKADDEPTRQEITKNIIINGEEEEKEKPSETITIINDETTTSDNTIENDNTITNDSTITNNNEPDTNSENLNDKKTDEKIDEKTDEKTATATTQTSETSLALKDAIAPSTTVATTAPATYAQSNAATTAATEALLPDLVLGETIVVSTAGVRVKHTFFTIYLTNIRLILQNNSGRIGREFAIADLKDAAELESSTNEPEIALSIGTQSGLRQMVLTFPTKYARDAWMNELRAKLPAVSTVSASNVSTSKASDAKETVKKNESEKAAVTQSTSGGAFSPAANERILRSTPNVRIKNRPVTIHLTNTRFVIDGQTKIIGEFALNTLINAKRLASEIGEPGIGLKVGSAKGEREMHLIFESPDNRESWMDAFMEVIPDRAESSVPETPEYTITTVTPQKSGNSQEIRCPSCGATNHVADDYCSLCGELLRPLPTEDGNSGHGSATHKQHRERRPYNGSLIGIITRPTDAFEYYGHDGLKKAIPLYLISGLMWTIITTLILAYLIPSLLGLEKSAFPILTALSSDLLLLGVFAGMVFLMWLVCVLLHSIISAVLARLFEPNVRIGEAMAITMQTSMTYAIVGWVPIFGMFAAGIWSAICSWKGLASGQGVSNALAAVAAFIGLVVVYAALLFIGGL